MQHNNTGNALHLYQSMSHEELEAERARLYALREKITTEWAVIKATEQQYTLSAERNYARLEDEIRVMEMAAKQAQDCKNKRFVFTDKRDASRRASYLRKSQLDPAWTYYKCPFCKDYHLTRNR